MNLWQDSVDDLLHYLIRSPVAREIMPRPGQLWMYSDCCPAFFAAFENGEFEFILGNGSSSREHAELSSREHARITILCGSAANILPNHLRRDE